MSNTNISTEQVLDLGLIWWVRFISSEEGKTLLKLLPAQDHYGRALELFQMGFAGRWKLCPPLDMSELDRFMAPPLCISLWECYLESCRGQILLDGAPYPNTPKILLNLARMFFVRGFASASVAWENRN